MLLKWRVKDTKQDIHTDFIITVSNILELCFSLFIWFLKTQYICGTQMNTDLFEGHRFMFAYQTFAQTTFSGY